MSKLVTEQRKNEILQRLREEREMRRTAISQGKQVE